MDQKQICYHS